VDDDFPPSDKNKSFCRKGGKEGVENWNILYRKRFFSQKEWARTKMSCIPLSVLYAIPE